MAALDRRALLGRLRSPEPSVALLLSVIYGSSWGSTLEAVLLGGHNGEAIIADLLGVGLVVHGNFLWFSYCGDKLIEVNQLLRV